MSWCKNGWLVLGPVLFFLPGTPARAHDLWLVPDASMTVGKPLLISANSGMEFPRSEHAPDTSSFARHLLIRPDGTRTEPKAAGKKDKSSLLRFVPSEAGTYVVAVETTPKQLTLSADSFNEYLVSDGLADVYRLRHREKSLDRPGQERYRKSPKVLVRVGMDSKGDPCQVVGLPLEIVPLRNPFALKPDDTLRVRVLFQGKRLAQANLGWTFPDRGDQPVGTTRTDARGEALLPIAQTGLMTVRLTHMTRPKTKDYEWESFWTTLTFRIPAKSHSR
jgi:uncharacterized GH25 family protein